MMVELTKDEAIGLVDLFEIHFFDCIRNDPTIDSMEWLSNMISIYNKCKQEVDDDL